MAEAGGKTLSDADVQKLKKLFTDYYGESGSTKQRQYVPSDDEYLTPEVYVALTPSGGIPALAEGSDVGTAFGAGDTPGSASCQIYQRLPDGTLQVITGLTRTVYNLSESAVDGTSWVLVVRDKYGNWYTLPAAPESVPCPPPPPAPGTGTTPTGIYYCVNGEAVIAGTKPPAVYDCGPFDYKPDCTTCTPIGAGSGPNIADATAYADPYTVGNTITLNLSKTGAVVGTVQWTIGPTDISYGSIDGWVDSGSGNTFAPTIRFDATTAEYEVSFLVQISDDGVPGSHNELLITRTVYPSAVSTRVGTGTLDDNDAYQLTQVNPPVGGFTLTIRVSALGRKLLPFPIENIGSGPLYLTQQSGELINGSAIYTLPAGSAITLYSDNRSTWRAV